MTRHVGPGVVALAWVYVGLRVMHSLVHLTYNRVRDRLIVYAASAAVLAMIWIRLFRALLAASG